jgi:hypothetical protein
MRRPCIELPDRLLLIDPVHNPVTEVIPVSGTLGSIGPGLGFIGEKNHTALARKNEAASSGDSSMAIPRASLQPGAVSTRAAMKAPKNLFEDRWLALIASVVFVSIAGDIVVAEARDNGDWTNSSTQIRQWFQGLMQPDNPSMSCCGEADAFEADSFEVEGDHYVAIITDGRGTIANGTRIQVPNQKMKWDKGNPTGHGIMDSGRQIYCYIAPGGV